MIYRKLAHTIQQQIDLLRSRGLIIEDTDKATHFLSNISYYRLAGYWWSMQSDKRNHLFKANSTFSNVIAIYNFDRELRLLIFDAIERIEIALRTRLIYHLSFEFDPWWFEDENNFINRKAFEDNLKSIDRELKQSREVFIIEHYEIYSHDLRRPPAWKTLEITSFGTLSRLYGNLKNHILSKRKIAEEFNTVNHIYLPSWLQSISYLRNICAHHSRLWNKNLPGKPKLMKNPPANWLNNVPGEREFVKLYIHVCCIKYLLDVVSPGHHITSKLADLFEKYPNIDLFALGFNHEWQNEPLWKN